MAYLGVIQARKLCQIYGHVLSTTLATSDIARHIDQLAACLTLFAWFVERRHQLRCPGIELRKRHHAKVVVGGRRPGTGDDDE